MLSSHFPRACMQAPSSCKHLAGGARASSLANVSTGALCKTFHLSRTAAVVRHVPRDKNGSTPANCAITGQCRATASDRTGPYQVKRGKSTESNALRSFQSVIMLTCVHVLTVRLNLIMDNPNPKVFERREPRKDSKKEGEPIDSEDVFDSIRDIQDPEHPYSLEQLNVVREELILVDHELRLCQVQFTPTIDHCSLATLIGLCIRTQLMRKLPATYKIDISITEGGHASEDQVNKQLNDKERVAAALENQHLLSMVDRCLATVDGSSAD